MPFEKGHQINRKDKVRSAAVNARVYPEIREKLDQDVARIKEVNPKYNMSTHLERLIAKR